MQAKSRWSRGLVIAGLLLVAGVMTSESSSSTLVANKWKVRPAPGRNYRRFYRDWQPGYGYGYGYGSDYGIGMPEVPMEEVPATGDLPTGSRHNNTSAPRRAR